MLVTCKRCGLKVDEGGYTNHYTKCQTVPLPDVVAQRIIDGATSTELQQEYGCSWYIIKARLSCSRLWRDYAKTLPKPRYAKRNYAPREFDGKVSCKKCGFLLAHPEAFPVGELCGDCAGEVPRFRDLQPFDMQYRYAPALVEDAW